MDFGYKIRKIRELFDLSQAYMAHELNITQTTYSKIERGEVKLSTERLMKISEILDIKIEQILYFDQNITKLTLEQKPIQE